jgi:hypothetical protein
VQNIRSDWFDESLNGAGRPALPQTFTVFGQKFVPDSWAFSQTVFNSIQWDGDAVPRRVPGALERNVFSLASIQARQVDHLQKFANVIEQVEKLVHKATGSGLLHVGGMSGSSTA